MAGRSIRLVLLVAAACGDNHSGSTADALPGGDSPVANPCWLDTYTPGGTVELGTGVTMFEPMPDTVALEQATQIPGFDMPTYARFSGLYPGDPSDILNPRNPRTRFHAWFVDTGEAIQDGHCAVRWAYAPTPGGSGTYDMIHGSFVAFPDSLTGPQIYGRQVRVLVEVIDGDGKYASDEKVVTCAPPVGS